MRDIALWLVARSVELPFNLACYPRLFIRRLFAHLFNWSAFVTAYSQRLLIIVEFSEFSVDEFKNSNRGNRNDYMGNTSRR